MELLTTPAWYRNPCTAKLILRIALGIGFIAHGWMKLSDLGSTKMAFEAMLGMGSFGVLVGVVELVAGVFVLVGLWTRYSALALAVIMIGAIFFVKLGMKIGYFGMELDIAYLAMALALAVIGSGRFSVEAKCCNR